MSNLPPMPPQPPSDPQGPYGNQGQPYPGQPYPGQAYPGQPYPGQPYPGQHLGGFTPPMSPGDKPSQAAMLVWSVLATILCCLPLGIVAIIKSMQIDSAWNQGRYDDARAAYKSAKKFVIFSVAVTVVLSALYIGLMIVAGTAADSGL